MTVVFAAAAVVGVERRDKGEGFSERAKNNTLVKDLTELIPTWRTVGGVFGGRMNKHEARATRREKTSGTFTHLKVAMATLMSFLLLLKRNE